MVLVRLRALFNLFTVRLSGRIVLWVFLSIVLAEAIVFVPSVQRRQQELLSHLKETSSAMVMLMVQLNRAEAADGELLVQVQQLMQNRLVLGGALYRSDGQQVGVFGEVPELSLAEVKDGEVTLVESRNSERYDVAWSPSQLKRNYKLILRLNGSGVQQELHAYIKQLAWLVLLISVFACAATILALEPTLIMPILRLRRDLLKAGESPSFDSGTFELYSASCQHQDELGEIIDAFKQIFQRGSEANALRARAANVERQQAEVKLREWNANLENIVAERTAELRAANDQLRQEMSQRQQIEAQLRHNAYHDALTGLPNRALFMEQLSSAIMWGKNYPDYLFAVLFLDLDRFKVVNDSLGHTFGDKLLKAIAQKLQTCISKGDLVARLGGDEFAILLKDIRELTDATEVAERIQQELTRSFMLDGQEVFTSVSIGIALSSAGYHQPEELLRDADIVMYRAKDRGRFRYEVFDAAMHQRIVAQLKLENSLRRAVKVLGEGNPKITHQFQLYYQPIIDLATGWIAGFEALVRWNHPKLGLVSPVEFIPIAEETGLIVPLGHWVLREACCQLVSWQQQFSARSSLIISVNLSGRQFSHSKLIAQIDQILQETGIEGNSLKLEITESVLMDNADLARSMLWELRARNIQLCMDDFGTGYSSLSYLHRFPLDTLKIDRSFVSMMGVETENSEIVQTILTLAHNLEMEVIAEGIETLAQLKKLQDLGCLLGQGYLFSKPVDSQTAGQLLELENRTRVECS